jgi:ssDNA-binding Zn-finger/Zn-ribbon topoisomerase 1
MRTKPLREILPPPDSYEVVKPTGGSCPSCGGTLVYGTVPCPDGKPGCCALWL